MQQLDQKLPECLTIVEFCDLVAASLTDGQKHIISTVPFLLTH